MNTLHFAPALPATQHMRVQVDAENQTFWLFMHSSAEQKLRPCCSLPIIEEGIALQTHLARQQALLQSDHEDVGLSHLVLASDAPVFNLGGDLELFVRCIRTGDRQRLEQYALRCVEAIAGFQDVAHGSVHSIAVVQGQALGGGFEVALSCNTIIAERDAQFGFPEALFGLFPGMGAYSLLKRRAPANHARSMILDSRLYSAPELYSMGIVDRVVGPGEGLEAAHELIRQQRRSPLAQRTVAQICSDYDIVSLTELRDITKRWVDIAMKLSEKNLRTIERLLKAQDRRFAESIYNVAEKSGHERVG